MANAKDVLVCKNAGITPNRKLMTKPDPYLLSTAPKILPSNGRSGSSTDQKALCENESTNESHLELASPAIPFVATSAAAASKNTEYATSLSIIWRLAKDSVVGFIVMSRIPGANGSTAAGSINPSHSVVPFMLYLQSTLQDGLGRSSNRRNRCSARVLL